MNITIRYASPAGFSGPSYQLDDAYNVDMMSRPEPITSNVTMHNRQWAGADGSPYGLVTVTGGRNKRSVTLQGKPHELRMIAADLNKLAAWLESPALDSRERAKARAAA